MPRDWKGPEAKTVAVVGGRDFQDYALLKKTLDGIVNIDKIVSGGAKGADSLARRYAEENDIIMIEFLPDWDKYGKAAGPIRNKEIIERSNYVVAFWNGKSRGTYSSIRLATKHQRKLMIVTY